MSHGKDTTKYYYHLISLSYFANSGCPLYNETTSTLQFKISLDHSRRDPSHYCFFLYKKIKSLLEYKNLRDPALAQHLTF